MARSPDGTEQSVSCFSGSRTGSRATTSSSSIFAEEPCFQTARRVASSIGRAGNDVGVADDDRTPTPFRARATKGHLVSSASLCHVAGDGNCLQRYPGSRWRVRRRVSFRRLFTQGDTWDELRANVKEAVSAYFFDQPKPSRIRLRLVRDEVLAVMA